MTDLTQLTELGKSTKYDNPYNPKLLLAIPRQATKQQQFGYDTWRAYELSWLENNIPKIATAVISYSSQSRFIVESKSIKLYLGSFNFTSFSSLEEVLMTIKTDLSNAIESTVTVTLDNNMHRSTPGGQCIDNTEIITTTPLPSQPNKKILTTETNNTTEVLHSNLFRSCCPVTSQPDWATIVISYSGKQITASSLLQYLLSFRNHAAFHESCISQIYDDLYAVCAPTTLTINGYFTRRGGIDINPCRSSRKDIKPSNIYLARQ